MAKRNIVDIKTARIVLPPRHGQDDATPDKGTLTLHASNPSLSRVTQPQRKGFLTIKRGMSEPQASFASATVISSGGDPKGQEVGRASLLTFLSRNKKVRRLAGRNPPLISH